MYKLYQIILMVSIRAYVQVPTGSEVVVVDLYDNGSSADTFADDGIYSRYFVNATSMGRYTVECEVWDDDGSAYVKHLPISRSTVAHTKTITSQPAQRTGEFTRMETGGSFMVYFYSKCMCG